jgi:hypothetical protein
LKVTVYRPPVVGEPVRRPPEERFTPAGKFPVATEYTGVPEGAEDTVNGILMVELVVQHVLLPGWQLP